jgi:hypothetical protein
MRCFVMLSALLACSCGGAGTLYPARGTVLYRNKPIKGAVVTFHPKGVDDVTAQRPSGVTEEDGSFTLTTGKKSGAPAGDYVVTIVWLKEPEQPTGKKIINTEGPPDPEDLLQGRFADHKKSTITRQVKSGDNKIEPILLQ